METHPSTATLVKEKLEDKDLPKWILRFLRSICPEANVEEIEGDLWQYYQKDREAVGDSRARRRLLWNSFRFLRPGILLRNKFSWNLNAGIMFRNHLKIGLRNLMRSKGFSAINISGLVIGISVATLILLWVQNELSYDRFHPDSNRLYEAWNRSIHEGNVSCWDITPAPLGAELRKYPEVEQVVNYVDWQVEFLFKYKDKRFTANTGPFTSSGFLSMFAFPLIEGDSTNALDDPHSIVLTKTFSRKLFGDDEAFGKSIALEVDGNKMDFTVTGIMKDLPNNTGFHFDYLLPLSLLESMNYVDNFWGDNSMRTYVKLRPRTEFAEFNKKIKDIEVEHYKSEDSNEIFLYPVSQLRLYSNFVNGRPAGGRIEVVRLFELVALFIVLISCINFMNLTTARSESRAREIGIRKTIGALRRSLVAQFLTESLMIAVFAGVASLLVIHLALPSFNMLTDKTLRINYGNPWYWGSIGLLITMVGFVAGSYPALYLSSVLPIHALGGRQSKSKVFVRRALVIFQFSFTIILCIAMLVIKEQIQYAQDRDIGYPKYDLVYHSLNGNITTKYNSYRHDLIASGAVTGVTKLSSPITQRWSVTSGISWQGAKDTQIGFDWLITDQDFAGTIGLTISDGRDLDLEKYPSDSSAALINESALKVMGFKDPIGEVFKGNGHEWHIVGVFHDFLIESPYEKIMPMLVVGSQQDGFNMVHIRLNSSMPVRQALSTVGNIFQKYSPEYPFEYHFVDQEYEKKFDDEIREGKLAGVSGGLSILISCLGILGLSIFIAHKRIREIGIRKAFGASAMNVVTLLSREPVRLMLIAFIIAAPLAWWAMKKWLEHFNYKVTIGWWVFALTALSILAIVLLTISIQTIRSALANPVKSLRSE